LKRWPIRSLLSQTEYLTASSRRRPVPGSSRCRAVDRQDQAALQEAQLQVQQAELQFRHGCPTDLTGKLAGSPADERRCAAPPIE